MSEELKTLLDSIRLGGESRMGGEVWEESDVEIVTRLIVSNTEYEKVLKARRQSEKELEIRRAYQKWLSYKEVLFAALCVARSLKFDTKVSVQVRINESTVVFWLHSIDSTSDLHIGMTEYSLEMEELLPYLT